MNVITNTQMAKVAINKSLLKEYDNRVVYLKDGDEFQIQLFNPKTTTIAAEILINGVSCGSKLVLRPGERVWLERYLDRSNKFKFTTYEVDDSSESADAIKNNGKIEVKFYNEIVKKNITWRVIDSLIEPHVLYSKEYSDCSSSPRVYYSNATTAVDNTCLGSSITTADISNHSCLSAEAATCTHDVKTTVVNSIKETGIIEDGSHSNQGFKTINKEFDYYPFNTERIQIYPVSQKPVYSEDVQKIYCTECGKKLQAKYKFCPFCGTQV